MELDQVFQNDEKVENDSEVENQEIETTEDSKGETTAQENDQVDESKDAAKETESKDESKDQDDEELEKNQWTFQAVKDERRKRQELEKQLKELQDKSEPKEKEQRPDVFDNQEAFAKSIEDKVSNKILQAKVDMARDMMIESHKDYEQMEQLFINEVANTNPSLIDKAKQAANPAKFVYEQAKKFKAFQDFESPDKMRESLRAEIRAELESEMNQAEKSKSDNTSNLKPSLAKARATDNNPFVAETLDTIFSK